jgi:hypothetical protein
MEEITMKKERGKARSAAARPVRSATTLLLLGRKGKENCLL